MQNLEFNSMLDQFILFGIVVVMTVSIVLPLYRYMKDRREYPLFLVYDICFMQSAKFTAVAALISFINSAIKISSLQKVFSSLMSLDLPSSIFVFMTFTFLMISIAFKIIHSQSFLQQKETNNDDNHSAD